MSIAIFCIVLYCLPFPRSCQKICQWHFSALQLSLLVVLKSKICQLQATLPLMLTLVCLKVSKCVTYMHTLTLPINCSQQVVVYVLVLGTRERKKVYCFSFHLDKRYYYAEELFSILLFRPQCVLYMNQSVNFEYPQKLEENSFN